MTVSKGIAVVAFSFAVIFALRALPFVLMSRASGEGRFFRFAEKWLSPVIIAGLVVYSFSTLRWRGYEPYVAGLATAAVQFVFRNGLVSIFAGTALYMALVRI